jgi:hypothetical protein
MGSLRSLKAAVAALAVLLGAAPVAVADSPCAAGALRGAEDGIGGTGLQGAEDGIGGTGLQGDGDGIGGTGIFGTVTRVADLCVNGLPVRLAAESRVVFEGRPGSAADLAVGQVVWVEARERSRALVARSVTVVRAAVGPVTAIDVVTRRLRVAGRAIDVPSDAVVLGAPPESGADLSVLGVGDVVAVYGLRRGDGSVVASRIDRAEAPASVAREQGPRLAELLREAPPLRRLSVEGYLQAAGAGARFRIDGLEVDAADITGAGALLGAGERVQLEGVLGPDRSLRVERATPLPPPLMDAPLARGAVPPPPATPPGEPPRARPDRMPNALEAADAAWLEMGRPTPEPGEAASSVRGVEGAVRPPVRDRVVPPAPPPVPGRPLASDLGVESSPIGEALTIQPSTSIHDTR